jgi:hypothetical protein
MNELCLPYLHSIYLHWIKYLGKYNKFSFFKFAG